MTTTSGRDDQQKVAQAQHAAGLAALRREAAKFTPETARRRFSGPVIDAEFTVLDRKALPKP